MTPTYHIASLDLLKCIYEVNFPFNFYQTACSLKYLSQCIVTVEML